MPRKKVIEICLEEAAINFSCKCPYCNKNTSGEISEYELGSKIEYECYNCNKIFILDLIDK